MTTCKGAVSRRSLLAAAGAAALPGGGHAQPAAFPSRPIRVVSPYTPGGGTDTTARLIAPVMQEVLGQPIVVENRAGAGGSIGAAVVAAAPPDGHTLLLDALGHVVNPHLLRNLPFDYATAFAPVSLITVLPQILVVPPNLPVASLAEFVAWCRARPGQLAYGSSGNATGSHLASVLFLRETGLDLAHVPYRGGSAVLPDLIAGNVVFAFATVNSASQLVRDGRLQALAVASDTRVSSLPDVPTMATAGYPAVLVDEWNGLYAPAGTPAPVLARLHAAVRQALETPAVRDRFAQIGAVTRGTPPGEFTRYVAAQREMVGRLVRDANITVE
ncbi:twin-arginine translocation pathway signal protein [Roseomonas hellenica]|uniref:Twin-arginine translocation pathway signal protein n=1 Tax=Plastoroseomonas hellenica TaxID=2687306 RepID=A0ABS5F6D4_9PROT|nr:tripartite tricarboxylate transporter substrate-binding protein [Plastoroseomonas hellenica]MBR0668129.1 twin-arginine translocation pathway signal protein [Plastoroseomonas hellenica]